MYMADNGERAPLADWTDALGKYDLNNRLACPLLGPYGYTMNRKAVGADPYELSSPARVVAVFDGIGGKNSVGAEPEIRWRHSGAAVFVYLDGHAKPEMVDAFEGLVEPYRPTH
jgi:prepilin-type processing-associated H-X9-DG protein